MDAANALINGLSGEKTRWTAQLENFADTIARLVGDVALACAFVSYCGPVQPSPQPFLARVNLCGAHASFHRPIPGHSIAAVRALKSSLWATAGGKGA